MGRDNVRQLVLALGLALAFTLALIAALRHPSTRVQAVGPSPLVAPLALSRTAASGLLPNGDMDQAPFYWRPTNHFVAGLWYEWFWTGAIPEFIDGGIPYHNVCYPRPTDQLCADVDNHSQGYIRWGEPFVAGVYQPVSGIQPCALYQFTIYNRNDSDNYHPKIGIDPTGAVLPPYAEYPDDLPVNCPPDGHSQCPNPGIEDISELPATIIWSDEFDHDPFTWASQSIVAEALSTTISVWTYAAPDADGSLSTYWDYGALVRLEETGGRLLADGPLPAADGQLTHIITSSLFNTLNFQWRTADPAFSQVLYRYVGPVTGTLPPIADSTDDFDAQTEIDWTGRTVHTFKLTGLQSQSAYDVALLSRRWSGDACQTSTYVTRVHTTDRIVPQGALPPTDGHIYDLHVIPLQQSAYVWWRNDRAARGQVLYQPLTTTAPSFTGTVQLYLPLLVGAGRPPVSYFEYNTPPTTTTDTVHWYYLTGLLTETRYSLAAVIAWTENGVDYFAASPVEHFQTGVYLQSQLDPAAVPPELRTVLCSASDLCLPDE